LKQFKGGIDFLMHISGLSKNRNTILKYEIKIQSILLPSLALVAVSCNSGAEKKESPTAKAEASFSNQLDVDLLH
jgi:hypothetical protein